MSEQQNNNNSNTNDSKKQSFKFTGRGPQPPAPKGPKREVREFHEFRDSHIARPPPKSFEDMFHDRVSWAARHSGSPKHAEGFMFFSCDATSLDVNNPEKAAGYKRPWMGRPVVLTSEQMEHILNYLGISDNELSRERREKPNQKKGDKRTERSQKFAERRKGGFKPKDPNDQSSPEVNVELDSTTNQGNEKESVEQSIDTAVNQDDDSYYNYN